MIALCSAQHGYSLQDLHRKSCSVLKEELNQIGFNLGNEGDLERILYPHSLSHPIGIGSLLHGFKGSPSDCFVVDLHESAHVDRAAPSVPTPSFISCRLTTSNRLRAGMVITIEPGTSYITACFLSLTYKRHLCSPVCKLPEPFS